MQSLGPTRFTDLSLILKQGFRLFAEWCNQNKVEFQTYPADIEDLPTVVAVNLLKGTVTRRRNIKYAVVMNVDDTPEFKAKLSKFGKVCKGYPWPQ